MVDFTIDLVWFGLVWIGPIRRFEDPMSGRFPVSYIARRERGKSIKLCDYAVSLQFKGRSKVQLCSSLLIDFISDLGLYPWFDLLGACHDYVLILVQSNGSLYIFVFLSMGWYILPLPLIYPCCKLQYLQENVFVSTVPNIWLQRTIRILHITHHAEGYRVWNSSNSETSTEWSRDI